MRQGRLRGVRLQAGGDLQSGRTEVWRPREGLRRQDRHLQGIEVVGRGGGGGRQMGKSNPEPGLSLEDSSRALPAFQGLWGGVSVTPVSVAKPHGRGDVA